MSESIPLRCFYCSFTKNIKISSLSFYCVHVGYFGMTCQFPKSSNIEHVFTKILLDTIRYADSYLELIALIKYFWRNSKFCKRGIIFEILFISGYSYGQIMQNPFVKDIPKIKQLLLDFIINNNTNTELCNLHVQYNLIIISNKYFNLYPISRPKDVLIPQTVQNFYV
jgi:hypothetical protein